MNLLFGLFRFLTWGNLISVSLLAVFVLISALFSPSIPALMMILMYATTFMHNYYCLRLQRTLRQPGAPLAEGFPKQIIILSVLAFIYAMYFVSMLIQLNRLEPSELDKLFPLGEIPKDTGYTRQDVLGAMMRIINFLFGIHAAAIAANCVLSSFFLNKWKKDREQAENNEHFFDV